VKAKIKQQGGDMVLSLPADAAGGFGEGEADILPLGPGILLVARAGLLQEKLREKDTEPKGGPMQAGRASNSMPLLSPAETALVRKLCAIRYEERLVAATQKKLGAAEAKLLEGLLKKGVLSIFKSAKYKDGVYNIPQDVFRAVSAGEKYGRAQERMEDTGNRGGREEEKAKPLPAPSVAVRSHDSSLPINSPAHLAKFGYMVLDNENEARAVMEDVKSVQKNDAVKGVRGFDRRYYVLRKSFLSQYQDLLLRMLQKGDADAQTLGAGIGLSPTACSVLLMILADEGEVLEKKKGMWGLA